MKLGLLIAVAAMFVSAVAAGSAQAVPFEADLDNAYLKTGASPDLDIIYPPDEAHLTGDLTLGAPNTFVTTPAQFQFPDFRIFRGAIRPFVEVQLDALEVITGTLDGTTGAVTTAESDFKLTLILDWTLGGNPVVPKDTCEISPVPMAFNTTQPYPSPFAGDPFTVDLANLATDALDDGAIATTWATLPAATPVPPATDYECATVDSLFAGRGGLWIADNIATPPPRYKLTVIPEYVYTTTGSGWTGTGSGRGTVTGPGINCPGDCTESFPSGTSVGINATPSAGSVFTGWTGSILDDDGREVFDSLHCNGTGPCALTMDDDRTATAAFTFAPQPGCKKGKVRKKGKCVKKKKKKKK